MAPPTSARPTRAPIATETTTLGLLRLNDIGGCIPVVELFHGFATGVPKACRRHMPATRVRVVREYVAMRGVVRRNHVLVVSSVSHRHRFRGQGDVVPRLELDLDVERPQ